MKVLSLKKTNGSLNVITHEPDFDEVRLYAKDPCEAKLVFGFYRILKYKKVEEYNPNKNQKTLIVINMIADMLSNRKLNPIVTELFIRGRKQNISLVFIRQSYFTLP